MKRLDGRCAVVTGASGSIGRAIARRFAEEGAHVAICDVAFDRAQAEVERLTAEGLSAFAVDLDVASEPSWEAATRAIVEQAGGVDILVNNAGVNDRGTVMSTILDKWHRTFAINLTGPLIGMRTLAPLMQARGRGAIVNICSLASLQGESAAGYGASKWGLRGLTKIAAMEFVDWSIRVNSISPAVVETEINAGQPYLKPMAAMTPMGRNGLATEIANAVFFLASDEASFVTGQDLAVDGGFTAGAAAKYVRKLSQ